MPIGEGMNVSVGLSMTLSGFEMLSQIATQLESLQGLAASTEAAFNRMGAAFARSMASGTAEATRAAEAIQRVNQTTGRRVGPGEPVSPTAAPPVGPQYVTGNIVDPTRMRGIQGENNIRRQHAQAIQEEIESRRRVVESLKSGVFGGLGFTAAMEGTRMIGDAFRANRDFDQRLAAMRGSGFTDDQINRVVNESVRTFVPGMNLADKTFLGQELGTILGRENISAEGVGNLATIAQSVATITRSEDMPGVLRSVTRGADVMGARDPQTGELSMRRLEENAMAFQHIIGMTSGMVTADQLQHTLIMAQRNLRNLDIAHDPHLQAQVAVATESLKNTAGFALSRTLGDLNSGKFLNSPNTRAQLAQMGLLNIGAVQAAIDPETAMKGTRGTGLRFINTSQMLRGFEPSNPLGFLQNLYNAARQQVTQENTRRGISRTGEELEAQVQARVDAILPAANMGRLASALFSPTGLEQVRRNEEASRNMATTPEQLALKTMNVGLAARSVQKSFEELTSVLGDAGGITRDVTTALVGFARMLHSISMFLSEHRDFSRIAGVAVELGAVVAGLVALRGALAGLRGILALFGIMGAGRAAASAVGAATGTAGAVGVAEGAAAGAAGSAAMGGFSAGLMTATRALGLFGVALSALGLAYSTNKAKNESMYDEARRRGYLKMGGEGFFDRIPSFYNPESGDTLSFSEMQKKIADDNKKAQEQADLDKRVADSADANKSIISHLNAERQFEGAFDPQSVQQQARHAARQHQANVPRPMTFAPTREMITLPQGAGPQPGHGDINAMIARRPPAFRGMAPDRPPMPMQPPAPMGPLMPMQPMQPMQPMAPQKTPLPSIQATPPVAPPMAQPPVPPVPERQAAPNLSSINANTIIAGSLIVRGAGPQGGASPAIFQGGGGFGALGAPRIQQASLTSMAGAFGGIPQAGGVPQAGAAPTYIMRGHRIERVPAPGQAGTQAAPQTGSQAAPQVPSVGAPQAGPESLPSLPGDQQRNALFPSGDALQHFGGTGVTHFHGNKGTAPITNKAHGIAGAVGEHRTPMGMRGSAPALSTEQQKKAAGEALSFWMSKGLTRNQAAGMVAQEKAESGFNPRARGDQGMAVGSFQWHPDRVQTILSGTGIDVRTATPQQQREAAFWELQHGEKAAWQRLTRADTAQDAGFAATSFERPAGGPMEAERRGGLASGILKSLPDVQGPQLAAEQTDVPASQLHVTIHSNHYMDGEQVASNVAQHFIGGGPTASSSGSIYDSKMMPWVPGSSAPRF